MKIGITQYAIDFDGKMNRSILEKIAQLQITGIEPYFAIEDDSLFDLTPNDIEQFNCLAQEYNVCVPSTALGVFNNDPALIEASGKQKAIDIITRALKTSAAFGATTMLLCTFIKSHPDTPEKKNNLLEILSHIEPIAHNLGIAIALETPLPADELLQLIQDAQNPRIGVYYDLGNAVALGFDPAKEIQTLNNRIIAVHIKDSAANTLGALHLGQGDLNLPAALDALKKINYNKWLILETPCEMYLTQLQNDLQTLKKSL